MKYKYHELKETYAKEVREFFAVIFGCKPFFEIRVLQDSEYEKFGPKVAVRFFIQKL